MKLPVKKLMLWAAVASVLMADPMANADCMPVLCQPGRFARRWRAAAEISELKR